MQGGEIPPFMRALTFCGHTFLRTPQEPSPCIVLSSRALHFPPCRVGESSFLTLSLSNRGCIPVAFSLLDQQLPPHFTFTPTVGVVPAGATYVLAARFRAASATAVTGATLLVLNSNISASHHIAVFAAGFEATVSLDVGSRLLCKPTCVGASSTRALWLHNHSRLPIAFHWDIPSAAVFCISPLSGILRGDTDAELTCTFCPDASGTFSDKGTCHVLSGRDVDTQHHLPPSGVARAAADQHDSVTLNLRGEGTIGALSLEPSLIDLGAVQVGSPVVARVTVYNHSPGVLQYTLETENSVGHRAPVARSSAGAPASVGLLALGPFVSVPAPRGNIPARSFLEIDVIVQPPERGLLNTTLVCRTMWPQGAAARSHALEAQRVQEASPPHRFPLFVYTHVNPFGT
jgi:cilia- and flagella-associated protein 65